jgi:hypothetical protein
MEATAPRAAPPPEPARRRWPAILIAIVFALVCLLFVVVTIDIAGTDTCEEAIEQAAQTGAFSDDECLDKSSANKAATVIAGALSALAALWTVIVAIGYARGRASGRSLAIAAVTTAVLILITFVL